MLKVTVNEGQETEFTVDDLGLDLFHVIDVVNAMYVGPACAFTTVKVETGGTLTWNGTRHGDEWVWQTA